jgi:hypothetical protein
MAEVLLKANADIHQTRMEDDSTPLYEVVDVRH